MGGGQFGLLISARLWRYGRAKMGAGPALRGNRSRAGASESVIESVRANGARSVAMRRVLAGLAVVTMGLLGAQALPLRANERPTPKGPNEDGTKPALVKIAGEGMMGSHAFQYLTELSDDIGSRVTGSPAERQAEGGG